MKLFSLVLIGIICACFPAGILGEVVLEEGRKPEHMELLLTNLQQATGLYLEIQGGKLLTRTIHQEPLLWNHPGLTAFSAIRSDIFSRTACNLLMSAVNSNTVYRVRSSRNATIAKVGSQIDLDFIDLDSITYRDVPREAFNAGMIFLHELVHKHRGLLDPESSLRHTNAKGPTVEFVNLIQKELGLPERLHYFPKKLPGRTDVWCIYFGNETDRVEIAADLFG